MALVGDLKDLALVDIIQINCVGRNTARLTVNYPTGEGVFFFQDGEVVDARLGNMVGIDAVYRALGMEEGSFRIDAGVTSPTRRPMASSAAGAWVGRSRRDSAREGRERIDLSAEVIIQPGCCRAKGLRWPPLDLATRA